MHAVWLLDARYILLHVCLTTVFEAACEILSAFHYLCCSYCIISAVNDYFYKFNFGAAVYLLHILYEIRFTDIYTKQYLVTDIALCIFVLGC